MIPDQKSGKRYKRAGQGKPDIAQRSCKNDYKGIPGPARKREGNINPPVKKEG